MEEDQEQIVESRGNWNLSKLARAQKMLEKGLSVAQVGKKLNLSNAQVAELEVDALDVTPKPEFESHQEWRKRTGERIEKTLVGIVDNHLEALKLDSTLLDPETMGTVKDASAIAHKWLRSGEEGGSKSLVINFQALAQVKATPLPDGTAEVIDVTPEA